MNENRPAVIIGTGAEGRIAQDILSSTDVLIYGFYTTFKEEIGNDINDIGVFGYIDDEKVLHVLEGDEVDYVVAIGDIKDRKKRYLKTVEVAKKPALNVIHAAAYISQYAQLGFGNIVNGGVYINTNAKIGDQNLFHTHVSVEPDCVIGSYCNINSGVRIGANVTIEDEVFIGTGAIIHPGITIGKGAIIGAGSVVLKTVGAKKTVFGNPGVEV